MPSSVSNSRPANVRFEPYATTAKSHKRPRPPSASSLASPKRSPSPSATDSVVPLAIGLLPPSAVPTPSGASKRCLTTQAQMFFEAAALPEGLKRDVLLHIASIPADRAVQYSRTLQQFVLKPNARVYPFALNHGLLQDIIDAEAADPIRTLNLAVEIITDAETIHDKSDLYFALIKLGKETPKRDAQILWALKQLPSFDLRLEAVSHLPRWQRKLMGHLGTYLQCLEPVLQRMSSADFRHLNLWPTAITEAQAAHDESEEMPMEPMGLCALQDFDDDEIIERMEEQSERTHGRLWLDLPDEQDENIMVAKRHFATHAAVGTLLAAFPLEPPTEALTPVIDLFLNQLAGDASLRQRYGVTQLDVSRAERSWSRAEEGRSSKPVNGYDMIAYLGDYKMPSARFAALIWRSTQCFIEADKTWQNSEASRSTMTTGFVKALARIQAPLHGNTYPDLPDDLDVKTSRRCHVGVTQELLSGLAGFYPFSLDQVTPAELLSVLAQNAFGGDEAAAPPDMYQVLSFAEEARKRARDIFKETPAARPKPSASGPQVPDRPLSAEETEALKRRKTDVEIFDHLLEEYLAYDFDFQLPAMAQTPPT